MRGVVEPVGTDRRQLHFQREPEPVLLQRLRWKRRSVLLTPHDIDVVVDVVLRLVIHRPPGGRTLRLDVPGDAVDEGGCSGLLVGGRVGGVRKLVLDCAGHRALRGCRDDVDDCCAGPGGTVGVEPLGRAPIQAEGVVGLPRGDKGVRPRSADHDHTVRIGIGGGEGPEPAPHVAGTLGRYRDRNGALTRARRDVRCQVVGSGFLYDVCAVGNQPALGRRGGGRRGACVGCGDQAQQHEGGRRDQRDEWGTSDRRCMSYSFRGPVRARPLIRISKFVSSEPKGQAPGRQGCELVSSPPRLDIPRKRVLDYSYA